MIIINIIGLIAGAANTIAGGVSSVKSLFENKKKEQARQDARQLKQQTALNNVNAQTSKELADYEQALKLKMWKDTNYTAQLREAQKAGVSKAAVLGGGGAGVGQGASVNSTGIGSGAANAAQTETAQLQKDMVASQIANINADTKVKEAQASNTETDTELKDIDAEFNRVRNEIQADSKWDQMEMIKDTARKMMHEKNIALTSQIVNERTYEDQIKKIQKEAEISALMVDATKAGTALTKAEAAAIQEKLDIAWEELKVAREGQQVSRENMEKLAETMLWQAGIQATGNIINSLIDIRKMKWSKEFDVKNRPSKDKSETTTFRNKKGNVTKTIDKNIKY